MINKSILTSNDRTNIMGVILNILSIRLFFISLSLNITCITHLKQSLERLYIFIITWQTFFGICNLKTNMYLLSIIKKTSMMPHMDTPNAFMIFKNFHHHCFVKFISCKYNHVTSRLLLQNINLM